MRLSIGRGNEREPKTALLSAAAREDRRIALSNLEREVKTQQGNVVCCYADVMATKNRIKELREELADAETGLTRRKQRHADAKEKLTNLQNRFESMKKASQA